MFEESERIGIPVGWGTHIVGGIMTVSCFKLLGKQPTLLKGSRHPPVLAPPPFLSLLKPFLSQEGISPSPAQQSKMVAEPFCDCHNPCSLPWGGPSANSSLPTPLPNPSPSSLISHFCPIPYPPDFALLCPMLGPQLCRPTHLLLDFAGLVQG